MNQRVIELIVLISVASLFPAYYIRFEIHDHRTGDNPANDAIVPAVRVIEVDRLWDWDRNIDLIADEKNSFHLFLTESTLDKVFYITNQSSELSKISFSEPKAIDPIAVTTKNNEISVFYEKHIAQKPPMIIQKVIHKGQWTNGIAYQFDNLQIDTNSEVSITIDTQIINTQFGILGLNLVEIEHSDENDNSFYLGYKLQIKNLTDNSDEQVMNLDFGFDFALPEMEVHSDETGLYLTFTSFRDFNLQSVLIYKYDPALDLQNTHYLLNSSENTYTISQPVIFNNRTFFPGYNYETKNSFVWIYDSQWNLENITFENLNPLVRTPKVVKAQNDVVLAIQQSTNPDSSYSDEINEDFEEIFIGYYSENFQLHQITDDKRYDILTDIGSFGQSWWVLSKTHNALTLYSNNKLTNQASIFLSIEDQKQNIYFALKVSFLIFFILTTLYVIYKYILNLRIRVYLKEN